MSYCKFDEAFGSPFQKEVELKNVQIKKSEVKLTAMKKIDLI